APVHRTGPGCAAARHRHRAGDHRAECVRARRRSRERGLRREGTRGAPQPLPDPAGAPVARRRSRRAVDRPCDRRVRRRGRAPYRVGSVRGMKAAVYYETGTPDVFRYEDVADPVVYPGGVLIDVEAISIEGGDTLNRAGGEMATVPHIVGY